jgi:hypothetical protein
MKVCKYYCDCCEEEIQPPKWKTVEIKEQNEFHIEIMLCEDCWYKKVKPLVMNKFKQEK